MNSNFTAHIIRFEKSDEGTFGTMLLNRKVFCATLELPWIDNKQNISCIQSGEYVCKRMSSPLIKRITNGIWETGFVLQGVPGRTEVMIHSGTFVSNTHGCILVAQYWGKLRGDRAILNTGETFNEFMTVTRNINQFTLYVMDAIWETESKIVYTP